MQNHCRKPLIIRGARQVGKTWLMQEFGRTCFSNTAYINFERERRLQQLISDLGIRPYYYSADNSRGELDFLIQQESDMIPVEVKAAENLRAKSLKVFVEKYGLSRGIRISMSDFRKQEWLVNLPLYAFMVLWKKTVI